MTRKLNLGCGPYKKEDYINIDVNFQQQPDLVRDVRKGLPYDDGSVEKVLACHFLEHLLPYEALNLIEEVYRVLMPSGLFTVVVPLGATGLLDHLHAYTSRSFDNLCLLESAAYYNRSFRWRLVSKEVRPDDLPWNTESLHVVLEAIK